MESFPIVGIGSSAGGLEALQALFRNMPSEPGSAFVVAAHLDPNRESHLSELLGRCTTMPVVQVEEAVKVEPDRIYVIAPNQYLTIRGGVLQPQKPAEPRGHRHPVDAFFRSLAEDQGERAIGVILSGTGTNGTLGLRFIKSEGGVTIVQRPDSASFDGMPHSAIATGLVDLILLPEEIARALQNLVRHPYLRTTAEVGAQPKVDGHLTSLLTLVRERTKWDFSSYRRRTLLRRIHRRMGLRQIEDLQQYIAQLNDDPAEITALARDLTINVTGFFRDPPAFKVLEQEVIARLIEQRGRDGVIRAWVPGCATGEEAYTIAMLLLEHAEAAKRAIDIRVFATDIADGVLASARTGAYPASIEADVDPVYLERFFEREDDTYCIKRALREAVTFAPQNLLQDPPFSRLDLISCRNLLIYLEPHVQKQVVPLFHFALKEGGYLFLGPAESVAGREDLFEPVSKKWRIYRRLGPSGHDIVDFPLVRASSRSSEPPRSPSVPGIDLRARVTDSFQRALLERHAPASVLIDRRFNVHAYTGPTSEYLQQPGGQPSSHLLALARQGLQGPIRAAVQKVNDTGQEASADGQVRRQSGLQPVQIRVMPLGRTRDREDLLVVSFFERPLELAEPRVSPALAVPENELEAELNAAREDLRQTVEQMETANEELKASYEEIRSINEELQASNEELETSKEELQSLNEELRTVNNQLQAKIKELEGRTNDLNNLLNSTDIATLFLDANLRIRWFTPEMRALLDLLPGDVGRPVANFAQKSTGHDLIDAAKEVLRTLTPHEVEVEGEDGRWYIRHILPYRTEDDRIDGLVVTFTDITRRKTSEQEIRQAKEFAEHIVEAVRFPLIVLTPDFKVKAANQAFYQTFEVKPAETEGSILYQLGNRQWDVPELRQLLERILPERRYIDDVEVEHEFEHIGRRTMLLHARPLDGAQLILLGMADITDRRRSEAERELLASELSHRVKNLFAVIQSLVMQTDGRARSIDEFREVFVGRIQALASAHSILLDTNWRGADCGAVVRATLGLDGNDEPAILKTEGAPVHLSARQATGLSLVLHELATNARKYGAWSRPGGHVRLAWGDADEQGQRVRLRWQESGGPPVTPPDAKGFGTRLIERVASYELDGGAELEYAPAGLSCRIVFPLH